MKLLLRAWSLAAALCLSLAAQAQLVTTVPAFPTMDDTITITFDATQGNQGLKDFTGPVYGHFGLVTAGPTSTTWALVVGGNFNAPNPVTLTTRIAPNLYQFRLLPRTFFPNATNVTGYRIGMLFRSGDGNTVGRTITNGDIFVDLYQPGQQSVRFTQPSAATLLLGPGESLPYRIEASATASISLTDNGAAYANVPVDTVLAGSYTSNVAGPHTLRAVADFGGGVIKTDSVHLIVVGRPRVADLPAGIGEGPNYLSPTSAVLVLTAPGKKSVFVRGDFNNWQFDTAYYMNRTPDSARYWIQIDNLTPGTEYVYQFTIDGSLTVGDPLCDKTSSSDDGGISRAIYPNPVIYPSAKATGVASVLRPGRTPYVWRHARPAPVPRERMVIYELLLRDFMGRTQDKTFQGLIDTLDYLQKLGVTAIELMPVSEFEGNQSWGYNVSFHGAVDKAYGPDDRLKALVDSCHGRGIHVILDVVYNQAFDQSPLLGMYAYGNNSNPYANDVARHPFNVGRDMNHESPYYRAYLDRCNQRWLQDYQMDGFRFDLSKGFTQKNTGDDVGAWGNLDRSRIRNLARIYTACKGFYPDATLILEHFADQNEEKILSDSVGFMLWNVVNNAASQCLMGYNSDTDMTSGWFRGRGLTQTNLVTFMESHDEERNMYKNFTYGNSVAGGYSTRDFSTAMQRDRALATIFLVQPGPKMLWEFEELGYDFSINRCENNTISTDCRTAPKPVRWDYYRDSLRRQVYKTYRELLRLRATEPILSSTAGSTVSLSGLQKRVTLRSGDGDMTAVANFALTNNTMQAGFTQTGRWYEFFSGDSLDVTATTQSVTLFPGEARIYFTRQVTATETGLMTALKGAAQPTAGSYRLVPNPSTGTVYLDGPAGNVTCTLLGADGRQLATRTLAGTERTLDLASLPGGKPAPGIYLVQLTPANRPAVRLRLVVQ